MPPGTESNQQHQYSNAGSQEAVVAKPLDQLPTKQRQKITMELTRIHKMVSAMDQASHRDNIRDKA